MMKGNNDGLCPICLEKVSILPPHDFVVIGTGKARQMGIPYGVYHEDCYEELVEFMAYYDLFNPLHHYPFGQSEICMTPEGHEKLMKYWARVEDD